MIRLALRVARAEAEIVLAELLELAPAGVEEVQRGDDVEYAVYGAPGELPSLPALRAVAGAALVDITTTEVADDWPERWRSFHKPVTIGERLYVRPPWADPAPAGLVDIAIDPGNAFGTGAHPTTRLCLEALLALEPGGPLVDIGCGSGVLAIAACKLGWDPVLAVDERREALAITSENAADNNARVAVRRFDVAGGCNAPSADTVLTNMLSPVLLRLAANGFEGPACPHTLVLSGMLPTEVDRVTAAFTTLGLQETVRRELGGWAMSVLTSSLR